MLVRGAGVIGLAVAEELMCRGHEVRVVDPQPGSGASRVAAGMLAPAAEAQHTSPEIWSLGEESLRLWPAFAERLGVRLHRTGTLLVGRDAGDLQAVRRQAELAQAAGARVEHLDRRALMSAEPSLSDRVVGGVRLPDDHSVDPRAVLAALLARLPVAPEASDPFEAEVTVLATGARLPSPYAHLVRPVRGEILRLRTDDPPRATVRGWAHGEPVYLVPRPGGEVVVGATSEEHDGRPVVTAGGVRRLLEAAVALVPGLDRAALVESAVGDRPSTPHGLPLIGPTRDPGVLLAAGHHRHGVLLAPLTARLVADHLETGAVHPLTDPRDHLEAPCPT
ncbi:glycine oxidase ThiO [Nocardioides acrostichi]|uniref:glycine oxidase n=1 Tax=Nocardioides acrostichi TaxID=2784339 RepID=A0A930YEL0_9ACTN|nr:glycine oxidase ThiO [Nocardioides acrostichi]MBF4163584.1 glycine oxidase ThiO [Nocardioides acrostichi]